MTPDALIAALHLFDRWALTLAPLTGEPMPELPVMPGRLHRLAEPLTEKEDAALREAEVRAAAVWRELAEDTEGGTHD